VREQGEQIPGLLKQFAGIPGEHKYGRRNEQGVPVALDAGHGVGNTHEMLPETPIEQGPDDVFAPQENEGVRGNVRGAVPLPAVLVLLRL
jgi:hypothetical protein